MGGIRVEGIDRVCARLRGIRERCSDCGPAMKAIGIYMTQTEEEQIFREQRDPVTGAPWKPLADSTIAARRSGKHGRFGKLGKRQAKAMAGLNPTQRHAARAAIARERFAKGRGRILFDTGRLLDSVTQAGILDVGAHHVTFGSNVAYAARHNYGYTGGSGRGHARTPQRRFLGVTDRARRVILDMLRAWVTRGKAK